MTGGAASWIWIVIIGACIGVYYLYKEGKIPWLKGIGLSRVTGRTIGGGIKLPRWFSSKLTVGELEAETAKERAKTLELRKVLDAKRSLLAARTENIRLTREIAMINEKSVGRAKLDVEVEAEAKKMRPRRL